MHRLPRVLALALAVVPLAAAPAPPVPDRSPGLAGFARAWEHVRAYRAGIVLYEKAGSQVQQNTYDYEFTRPSNVSLKVVSGPSTGGSLSWDGGPNVVARKGSGFIGIFHRTLPLHDRATTTIRGSSVDLLGFGAILAHALQTPGTITETPGQPIAGEPTQDVTLVPAAPQNDSGYTREVVTLSARTHLPLRVLGYERNDVVRRVDFTGVVLAPATAAP